MKSGPNEKLKTVAELQVLLRAARARGRAVVFTNGCFDLLHVGHVRYLQSAKREGDLLLVALNSDRSVQLLKGPGRPLQSEDARAEIISSIECVDFVVIFDDFTVDGLLGVLRPDVHAKGTDYTSETVPERKTVLAYGGRVAIVGDPKDHSTRDLIDVILSKFPR
jgi:D-glycero-beta-D-manno-heptose 1-phosphate adenylyltransferase